MISFHTLQNPKMGWLLHAEKNLKLIMEKAKRTYESMQFLKMFKYIQFYTHNNSIPEVIRTYSYV